MCDVKGRCELFDDLSPFMLTGDNEQRTWRGWEREKREEMDTGGGVPTPKPPSSPWTAGNFFFLLFPYVYNFIHNRF